MNCATFKKYCFFENDPAYHDTGGNTVAKKFIASSPGA